MVTGVYIAQAIGSLGCMAAAGGMATLSIACIPNILLPAHSPPKPARSFYQTPGNLAAHLSHQWLDFYDRGHKIFPAIAGFASLANLYVFWGLRDMPVAIRAPTRSGVASDWSNYYLFAAVTAMSIVPWTILTMLKTNKKLDCYAMSSTSGELEGAEADNEVPQLLRKWARLNVVRAIFPFFGAVISLYATSLSSGVLFTTTTTTTTTS